MKTSRLLPLSAVCFAALSLTGCGAASIAPLWSENKKDDEKVTVVISDLHLGLDHAFAENVTNIPYLIEFLKRAQATPNIDEIVIDGDFLDGWYMPFSYGPVGDYAQFYAKVAAANQNVVDTVNAIIKEGKIKVVYVPETMTSTFHVAFSLRSSPGSARRGTARASGLIGRAFARKLPSSMVIATTSFAPRIL